MLCSKPFRQGILEYGCGQCMPCRISRRRLWATRLMLEARKHKVSLFVTLTYRDKDESDPSKPHIPDNGSLEPKHLQGFLKRVRSACGDMRVRFYAVGEYGDVGQRPHYHLCMFGADEIRLREAIKQSWKFADIRTDIRILGWDLAWYIVGYVTKKMTNDKDELCKKWLRGRHPEFARMSLRPGIGALAVGDIAQAINSKGGARYTIAHGDVPSVVRVSGKTLPLGRYLHARLRVECGYEPKADLALYANEVISEIELQGYEKWMESRANLRGHHKDVAKKRISMANSKRGSV